VKLYRVGTKARPVVRRRVDLNRVAALTKPVARITTGLLLVMDRKISIIAKRLTLHCRMEPMSYLAQKFKAIQRVTVRIVWFGMDL